MDKELDSEKPLHLKLWSGSG